MSRITSHQYNWTATTRLHGEGVLRHDMTAHEQRRPPPPPPSSGGGCTDATRGWECSSNSVPSIYRLAGWWHKAPSRVVEGRVVSWTDRSWKKRTHAVLRHVEGHKGKPDQCRLLFCSLPQTDGSHGRDLFARAWAGLGRSA